MTALLRECVELRGPRGFKLSKPLRAVTLLVLLVLIAVVVNAIIILVDGKARPSLPTSPAIIFAAFDE